MSMHIGICLAYIQLSVSYSHSDFNKYIGKLETLQKYKDEEFSK